MKTDFTKLSLKEQDASKTVKFTVNKEAGIIVCTLIDRWYGKRFIGKTKVHDVDKWNEKKGRAIAFNKAKRKELLFNIKQCETELNDLTEIYATCINKVQKRLELNNIYLAGADLALEELIGKDN